MAIELMGYLDEVERLIAGREAEVLALLPEEGRFARLRGQATDLLLHYTDPATRPALFGSLVGVKDIIHADGFLTRAGSDLPPDLLAGPEASCVTALKNAGALILGKTVTTEFAYFAPGPTRHPLSAARGETRTPGGSSSGSAAAVAAGYAALALGTQTIGSIIRPAAFCGVVGFKPSFGRVATDGVIPLAPSADTLGWLAASVDVTRRAASVLLPNWYGEGIEGEPISPAPLLPFSPAQDKNLALRSLGIPEGSYLARASAEGMAHFRAVVRRLESAGYDVRPVPAMPDFDDIYRRHNALVAYEAARTHTAWFAAYGDLYHPKTADLIKRGQTISESEYQAALAGRARLRDELHGLMDAHAVDLWIAPAAVGAAPRGLEGTGDPVMALPWTHAGVPALALPAGTDAAGWPLGLQLVGRFGADERLLQLGDHIASALR